MIPLLKSGGRPPGKKFLRDLPHGAGFGLAESPGRVRHLGFAVVQLGARRREILTGLFVCAFLRPVLNGCAYRDPRDIPENLAQLPSMVDTGGSKRRLRILPIKQRDSAARTFPIPDAVDRGCRSGESLLTMAENFQLSLTVRGLPHGKRAQQKVRRLQNSSAHPASLTLARLWDIREWQLILICPGGWTFSCPRHHPRYAEIISRATGDARPRFFGLPSPAVWGLLPAIY